MKKIAIIDLGTNTFNLLVAEKNGSQIHRIFSTKDGVALGLGGINENKISDDAIERAMVALRKFCLKSSELGAEKIIGFGTSALRNARNANQLVEQAKKELGLSIEIISGEREAELIYKGVASGYQFDQPSLIMDIGGGSTEFILADHTGIIQAKSFEIGVSRIYQKFKFSDPLSEEDISNVTDYLNAETGAWFDSVKCFRLIGASGSFETFYQISREQEFPETKFVQLNLVDVQLSLKQVIESTQAEREKNPYIIPIRKKMAPLAAIKTKWIIDKLGIKELVISPFALKEGVISEM